MSIVQTDEFANVPCCFIGCTKIADFELLSNDPQNPYHSSFACEEHKGILE